MDHLAAHRIPQARVLLALRQAQERRLHAAAPAALLPRPVADRAVLVQAQDAAEPRSIAAIDEQIGPALDTITLQDARGWFRHCGYPVSN